MRKVLGIRAFSCFCATCDLGYVKRLDKEMFLENPGLSRINFCKQQELLRERVGGRPICHSEQRRADCAAKCRFGSSERHIGFLPAIAKYILGAQALFNTNTYISRLCHCQERGDVAI